MDLGRLHWYTWVSESSRDDRGTETMRRDAQPVTGGIYRPRNPRVSPLYQCLRRHRDELDAAGLIHRPVEAEVLERFLDGGDLHKGFARVYCDQ